jgi:PAS domain S-box-containing protein
MDDSRYRSIFEHAAIALFEEDIRELRAALKALPRGAAGDMRAYLDLHPEFLARAVRMIRIVDANAAALQLLEIPDKGRLLGSLEAKVDLANPDAAASLRDDILSIAEGRKYHERQSQLTTPSGKRLSLIIRTYVPPDSDPYPNMLVSFIDASALVAAKEYAETLIQTANVMVVGLDLEGRVTTFNRAAEQITGYSRAELLGRSWFETVAPPGRYPEVQRTFQKLPGGAIPRIFENPVLTSSGEQRHIAWQNNEVREQGQVVGSISFGLDITERKRLEDRNLRLAELVEASDDAIESIAMDRSITSWNRGAERIYGYSAEEMLGRPTSLLIPPEYEEEARLFREKLSRGEHIEHFETVRRRKDGKLIDVSLTLFPIRDRAGGLIGMASIARDITASKAVRAQLERALRLESLSTLARGIAHQFNNLHTIILGYLGLLQRLEGLPPGAAKYVNESRKALQRAADITDRLHGLTGSAKPLGQPLHLERLVQSLLPLFEKSFQEQQVEVRRELEQTPPLRADPSRLGFVITSLLSNALHALTDSTVRILTLRSGLQEGRILLEVRDSGCGIPAENLPKLFSPFFTTKGEFADPGSSQAGVRGVGLSLAVCHSIVSEYEGSIEAAQGPEGGAIFRVWFPASGSH